MSRVSIILVAVFGTSFLAWATEEYAEQSGQVCAVCHVQPAGGGLHRESVEVKILYAMAYLNLTVALGVVWSLWQWG